MHPVQSGWSPEEKRVDVIQRFRDHAYDISRSIAPLEEFFIDWMEAVPLEWCETLKRAK